MEAKKAIILLSGGLDSTTTLAIAVDRGYRPYSLSVRYGQRHSAELSAAARIAREFGVVEHRIVNIDLGSFGGSALTDDTAVPKGRTSEEMESGIPVTYVPARNTVFLSLALAWAEVLGANDIFIGVNAIDYSGYPDCRPEYLEAFQSMARLATKAGVEGDQSVEIHAPLIGFSKAEIIAAGTSLGVDYGLTVTCYEALQTGEGCGECDACQLRLRGFAANGIKDPVRYVEVVA